MASNAPSQMYLPELLDLELHKRVVLNVFVIFSG
jgi:hypothetical protein